MRNSLNISSPKQQPILFLAVFLFLLSIYLLSYNGFPVSDDEHIFAAVSQSLASHGSLNPTQVYGNPRVSGTYQGVGPLHSWIGALLLSLLWKTNLGALQSLYLLNPVYTAATGGMIFLLANKNSYHRTTGIIAALLFGLTTIAWPYTQTFYREPLAMLLITASLLTFETALESRSVTRTKQIAIWLLFLLILIGALLTKIILLVTIPCFVIIFFLKKSNRGSNQNLIFITTFLAGACLFLIIFSWLAEHIFFNRLSWSFIFERLYFFWHHLTRDSSWVKAVIGILVSPGKGLFIYSPITLLILISIFKYRKVNLSHQLFCFGATISIILVQAVMYKNEWWNISWGTRVLLPVLPLMMLCALPVIDQWISGGSKSTRFALIALSLMGFIIQLGRVLIADVVYLEHIYTRYKIPDLQMALWRLDIIPIIKHWELLIQGALPNIASFRVFPQQPKLVLLYLVTLIFLGILSSQLLISKKLNGHSFQASKAVLFSGISVILTMVFLLNIYRSDPLYREYRTDFRNITSYLGKHVQKDDIILVDHYMSEYWFYFFNFGRVENPWFGLNSRNADLINNDQQSEIRYIIDSSKKIWLVYEKEVSIGEGKPDTISENFLKIDCWGTGNINNQICLSLKEN